MKSEKERLFKINLSMFGTAPAPEDDDEFEDIDLDDFEEDDNLDDDAGKKPDLEPEKKFTQADIDRIVGERLAREKKQVSKTPHQEFVEKQATRLGITPEQYMQRFEDTVHTSELQREALEKGKDPDQYVHDKQLEERLNRIEAEKSAKEKTDAAQAEADEAWIKQEKEFMEAHPEVDLKKLNDSETFTEFAANSNPRLSLLQIYNNYVKLVGKAEAEAITRSTRRSERSTGSGREPAGVDADTMLTKEQRILCKRNGIDPKKFLKDLERGNKMMK